MACLSEWCVLQPRSKHLQTHCSIFAGSLFNAMCCTMYQSKSLALNQRKEQAEKWPPCDSCTIDYWNLFCLRWGSLSSNVICVVCWRSCIFGVSLPCVDTLTQIITRRKSLQLMLWLWHLQAQTCRHVSCAYVQLEKGVYIYIVAKISSFFRHW